MRNNKKFSKTARRPRRLVLAVAFCSAFLVAGLMPDNGALGPRTADADNLVANGNFESPRVSGVAFVVYAEGQSFGGWTVVPTNVDCRWTSLSSVDHVGRLGWKAAAGRQSVDLSGVCAGAIAQTLATEPGQQYKLRFSMAGNLHGPCTGDPDVGPVKQLQVYWGGQLVDSPTFDTTGLSFELRFEDMGWIEKVYVVTATGPSTELKFASLTQICAGPAIDHVRVGEADDDDDDD